MDILASATINSVVADISKIAINYLIAEFKKQGHSLTGAFEAGVESQYEKTLYGTTINILFPYYGKYLQLGVPAEKIPFGRAATVSSQTSLFGDSGGGAKTSKYIQALANYAKLRLNAATDKDATSIAFAIAKTHKKEGMPTKSSEQFSSTGRRIGFVDAATPEIETEIEKYISKYIAVTIETILINAIT